MDFVIIGGIITAIAGVTGIIVGIFQVMQYLEQRREKEDTSNDSKQADMKQFDITKWMFAFPSKHPLEKLYLRTDPESEQDLLHRIETAKVKFTAFGLTRNFFVSDPCRQIIERRSCEIPIILFLMDPKCDSRKDRYRIEPIEAALEDPNRFTREVIEPFRDLVKRTHALRHKVGAGLQIYFYNFPCSFAIEEIDNVCRVMLYGHGKRGTDGPIFIFKARTPYFDYFTSQLRWLEDLAINGVNEPWKSKGIQVWPILKDNNR